MGVAALAVLALVSAGCSTFENLRGNNQYGADQHLKDNVQDALKKDPLYKFPDVSVTAYRGDVQLGGVIALNAQRQEAMKDASNVPGVLNVRDNMMLNTNQPVVPE